MANRSRRRRSAWGSVHEVSPGVWRIRYWGKGPDGEYRRRSCTVRGSRVDAERRRSELMVLHSEEAPCPTVGEVWDSYALPDLERRVASGDVAASTLKQYRPQAEVFAEVMADAYRQRPYDEGWLLS